MRFNLGIRAQLGIGIVLITLAGIGFIGMMSIKIVEDRAVYWKMVEAENIVTFIRAASVRFVSQGERQRMVGFVASALKETGIKEFRLTDASGKTLLEEGELPEEGGTTVSYSDDLKVERLGGGWLKGPGEELYIKASLSASGTGTVGAGGAGEGGGKGLGAGQIDFTVPLTDINEDMAGVRRFLLLYALLDSSIIIAFGFYFLSGSIVKPIRKLKDTATRIAGGGLGERADVSVDNEIGTLAASFNTMAERLENEIRTLERVNNELVSTQGELLKSSTLAAVGRLAAGIAHEIGNPLGALGGYLDILEKGLPSREEEMEILQRSVKELGRIDAIVREFLELSKPAAKPAAPVDVNRMVRESVSDLEMQRDFTGITVTTRLGERIPGVMIDEGKLRQVLVNLLVNAAQAMAREKRREITLATAVEKHLAYSPRRPKRRAGDLPLSSARGPELKDFVVIRITDTGTGIAAEDAKKIFDPFFTTKEVGKGTGLGLFVCLSIIKTYGGEIDLETKVGRGTTFTVKLPSRGEVV